MKKTNKLENLTLEEKVLELSKIDKKFKDLEDAHKKLKNAIKAELVEKGQTECKVEGFRTYLTPAVKKSFDEEKLIELSHKLNLGITKMVEQIDEKEIENKIYHNEIDPCVLAPYEITTTTYRIYTKYEE